MDQKDIVMIKGKELKRLKIVQEVIEKHITQREAVSITGLSERQMRRMVKKVRVEGETGIIHQLRGKPSSRRISNQIKDNVIKVYREKYPDFGPTLANEKLFEIDKIEISTSTLRKWLIEEGEWKSSRKHRKHHKWRERKHCFGQMIQMDGSHHNWLEGRGSDLVMVIMSYIDDATNTVFARFYGYEGTIPAMDSFRGYIELYGIPQSLYVDKHTTYKSNGKLTIEEELEGLREPMSQFERALDELGVKVIHANSPQAKGRIERLFRTFQDRVIKEMRLANICTMEEANRFLEGYLPIYNQKFGIAPTNEANLHRKIPKEINLDSILSIKTKRSLRNDLTVAHNKQLYQIEGIPSNNRIKVVWVEERIDKTIHITYNSIELKWKKIETKQSETKEKTLII